MYKEDNKLVEMSMINKQSMGETTMSIHTSLSGDSEGYSDSNSSQVSSDSEGSTGNEDIENDSSADSEEEDHEDPTGVKNKHIKLNVNANVAQFLSIRVPGVPADYGDDDDNVLNKNSNVLKLYVHAFDHYIRASSTIARQLPLVDADLRQFCNLDN